MTLATRERIKPFTLEQHARLSIYSQQLFLIYKEVGATALAETWLNNALAHEKAAERLRNRIIPINTNYQRKE